MSSVDEKCWRRANNAVVASKRFREVAERIAREATAFSRARGGKANYTLQRRVRPGGRAEYIVISDRPEEEFGAEGVPKINALRTVMRRGSR